MAAADFIVPLLKVALERCSRIEVVNRPSLVDLGGAVLACNHTGWADGLAVAYAVYPRRLYFMSKDELFDAHVLGWILEQLGGFPISRERPLPGSIKTAKGLLVRGELVLIYPAGTRGNKEIAFKRGAVTLALMAGVPIVHILYVGPGKIRPLHFLRRPIVRVIFGKPIPAIREARRRDVIYAISGKLKAEISKLGTIG
jgi:1-acyl-sn-glycerol-3-phosphate acyltransferase